MEVARTLYSKIIDTLLFLWSVIMISATLIFFLNIRNDVVSLFSIIISITIGLIISLLIFIFYSTRFPLKIRISNETVELVGTFKTREIDINGIKKVTKINTMSSLSGSVTYKINFSNFSILVNSKRYKNIEMFIKIINENFKTDNLN